MTNFQIGVDGGGTKTDLILVDATGAIVARHTAPGCNPSLAGPDRAREILHAALAALRADRPAMAIQRTLLCMAGAPGFWRELAAGLRDCGRVDTARDSLPVLELATDGRPGLVLHAGTGSFVAARGRDDALYFAGGLGWRLGDPGSAQDVARRAATRAMLERQGWHERSPLGDALCAHAGQTEAAEISRWLYLGDEANARLGAFAPKVVELAAAGCTPALQALAGSLAELVAQARLVTDRLFAGDSVPCGISGSLLNSEPAVAVLRSLATAHHWAVEFRPIAAAPIEGVRRLLARGA